MIANSLLGYGVVKTLSYINEPQDIHPANTTSQLTTATSLALSPRKRKARGMFSDDNISRDNCSPRSNSTTRGITSFHYHQFSKFKSNEHRNSITPTPEHHNSTKDNKGTYILNLE